MPIPITIDGFAGQQIELQPATFVSGPKLLVNGQIAPKGPKRGTMLLRRADGSEAVAQWKPAFFGLDTPALVVDGTTIAIVKPLPWYQWVWSALPILLVLIGGLIGAVLGIVAASISIKIFRSRLHPVLQFVVSALVSLAAVALYLAVVIAIAEIAR